MREGSVSTAPVTLNESTWRVSESSPPPLPLLLIMPYGARMGVPTTLHVLQAMLRSAPTGARALSALEKLLRAPSVAVTFRAVGGMRPPVKEFAGTGENGRYAELGERSTACPTPAVLAPPLESGGGGAGAPLPSVLLNSHISAHSTRGSAKSTLSAGTPSDEGGRGVPEGEGDPVREGVGVESDEAEGEGDPLAVLGLRLNPPSRFALPPSHADSVEVERPRTLLVFTLYARTSPVFRRSVAFPAASSTAAPASPSVVHVQSPMTPASQFESKLVSGSVKGVGRLARLGDKASTPAPSVSPGASASGTESSVEGEGLALDVRVLDREAVCVPVGVAPTLCVCVLDGVDVIDPDPEPLLEPELEEEDDGVFELLRVCEGVRLPVRLSEGVCDDDTLLVLVLLLVCVLLLVRLLVRVMPFENVAVLDEVKVDVGDVEGDAVFEGVNVGLGVVLGVMLGVGVELGVCVGVIVALIVDVSDAVRVPVPLDVCVFEGV